MATDLFDLTGRVALVTGASSGLGARFARTLAAAGAKVALAARRTDRLVALQASIEAAGGTARAVTMDTTNETSIAAGFDQAEVALGPVDTVIANAGVTWAGRSIDMPAAGFDELIAVNLRGVFLTAREAARRMIAAGSRERQDGRILLIGSITASAPETGLAAYSASKAAVVQMGKVMAVEWMRLGINVNILSPGYVRTEMTGDWFDTDGGRRQVAGFPRRRAMDDRDLDGALLFLASEASRAVTGAELIVDDGQSL